MTLDSFLGCQLACFLIFFLGVCPFARFAFTCVCVCVCALEILSLSTPLKVFRSDVRALEAFKYESDWALARPILLVLALLSGQLDREKCLTWEQETTKDFHVLELVGGARSMLRDPNLVADFGSLLSARVDAELSRVVDPDEEEIEALSRGVKL